MSTNNPTQPGKKRKRSLLYLALIILLVIINGVLFYTNMQTREENKVLSNERQELLVQKATYERQIDSLKIALKAELGLNAELDSIINLKIQELDSLKIAFNKQLSSKDYAISRLKKDLAEKVAELKQRTREYTAEVADLKAQYAALEQENENLSETVTTQTNAIEALEDKVQKGSVLSAIEIVGTGYKIRNNGKEKETDNAKKVDKLRICYQLAENRIAEPGYRDILVKITSPEGSTLSVESLGSGTFQLAETGETSLYTAKMTIEYDPGDPDKKYCLDWEQEGEYEEGTYTVELYQKGFLIGTSTLVLDDGGLF